MTIKYLSRNEIDTQRWDECIAKSVNGIAYAYSWFLDIVADDWDALVGDDYQAVFPLAKNRRYGIDFVFQPHFAKQLGLFSTGTINPQLVNKFIIAIPQKFKYINLNLNTYIKTTLEDAKLSEKATYQLDLIEPYPILSARYAQFTKNSISKAIASGVSVVRGLSAFLLLEMKMNANPNANKKKDYELLTQIITTSVSKGVGETYGAYSPRNELCAAIFLLRTNSKCIFILGTSNDEGLEMRALYSIIDHFIHQNAEKQIVFDFGDSPDEDSKKFYQGFGAQKYSFQSLSINRLPLNLKLFN